MGVGVSVASHSGSFTKNAVNYYISVMFNLVMHTRFFTYPLRMNRERIKILLGEHS